MKPSGFISFQIFVFIHLFTRKKQFETGDVSEEADCNFNETLLIEIVSDVIKGTAATPFGNLGGICLKK